MKSIVIFFVVVLVLAAESAVRGKSHKSQSKAVKEENAPEPGGDDGDGDEVEWPQVNEILGFSGTDDSARGGHQPSREHGKTGRKPRSH